MSLCDYLPIAPTPAAAAAADAKGLVIVGKFPAMDQSGHLSKQRIKASKYGTNTKRRSPNALLVLGRR